MLYRKIDSTLRGHVGPELAATLRVLAGGPHAPVALFAPAFPGTGRTTRGGEVLVKGVLLERTEVWRDARMGVPARPSELLRHAGLRARVIPLERIRGGEGSLEGELERRAALGTDVLVCDAETEEDLAALARAGARLDRPVVWTGSAGLARHLPAALGLRPATAGAERPRAPVEGPVAILVGSRSSIAREQARVLAEEPDLDRLVLQPSVLLAGEGGTAGPRRRWPAPSTPATTSSPSSARSPAGRSAARPSRRPRRGSSFPTWPGSAGSSRRAATWRGPPSARSARRVSTSKARSSRACRSASRTRGRRSRSSPRRAPSATRAPCPAAGPRSARRAPAGGRPEEESMARPVVAITMGDPAGVGPEIVMKALGLEEPWEIVPPAGGGRRGPAPRSGKIVHAALEVVPVADPAVGDYRRGRVDCIDVGLVPPDLPWGKLSAAAGNAAYHYVARAVELAMAGKVQAICTAPLNKEALHAGGHVYPGHTELLAELSGTKEVSMMLATPRMRVIHVTTHIGLLDAMERIEPGLVERTILRGHEALVRAGIERPRIAVCGINPHAGEHGLFGRGEEETKIVPAVEAARAKGVAVEGPLPADTVFFRAGRGDFDLVVAMYHDQGHGPVKVLGLEAGVNVTVGLPFVRTSVDHGTAFDIAGTGKADERSLVQALRDAVALAPE